MVKMTTKIGFLERKMSEHDWKEADMHLTIIDGEISQAQLEDLKNGLGMPCGITKVDDEVLFTDFITATLIAAGWDASTKYHKFSDGKIDLNISVKF
ncbi:hypothetical protein C4565_04305 [Candidatus Parcubacteria bacterium]|jgi:hypothetical protein|nr:MAG: hypothetical protein C4565_04305 [Candidatus Parcubacteria bacterium]